MTCLYQLISFSKHWCNYCLIRSDSYLQSPYKLSHSPKTHVIFPHSLCDKQVLQALSRQQRGSSTLDSMTDGDGRKQIAFRTEETGKRDGSWVQVQHCFSHCWDWALKRNSTSFSTCAFLHAQKHSIITRRQTHPRTLLPPCKHVIPWIYFKVGRWF